MRVPRRPFAHALERGDPVLVAVLSATAAVDVLASGGSVRGAVIAGAVALPLVARRRVPLAVLALIAAAFYVDRAWGPPEAGSLPGWVALNVAVYTVAAHCHRRRAIAGAAIVAAVLLPFEIGPLVEGARVANVVAEWLLVGGVWLLGRWARRRRRRTRALEEHAERLEADRDARARAAVARERARIARELHDSVAHSVSVMVLQAGAAEQVMTVAPDRARASLLTIQDTGREAIAELHRLLGLLRDPAVDASLAPQPSVARLDALLEQVRGAGLPVELTVEGEARRLPPGVDRSAYRIVQEALTNTLKHAGPAHASVTLRYRPQALELEVLDDGRGISNDDEDPAGFGLVGMRERAALYGGALDAGPRSGGGYALRARLPFERAAP